MRQQDLICENCGHDTLESFIDRPGHQLKRCPECNLFQKGVLESNDVYEGAYHNTYVCLLYTSPSPRDLSTSRMPSSA